jgi:hypothetical protein
MQDEGEIVSEKKSWFNADTGSLTFIDSCQSAYDLPLIWKENVICYVEDEEVIYISAGPAVWKRVTETPF